jgi:aminoglycoside phosphotransferase (APT) family kinase protein
VQGRGRTLLFIFADEAPGPALLVKVLRDDADWASLQREHAHLQKVRSLVTADIRATIPEPLAVEQVGRDRVAVERVLPGHAIESRTSRDGRRECWLSRQQKKAAENWILSLHRQTTTGRTPFCADILSAALAPLAVLREYYALTPQEDRLAARLHELTGRLAGQTLPLVCQHGDFWTGNILWRGSRLEGVIDWEFSRFNSLPFLDLFLFAQDSFGLRPADAARQCNPFVWAYFETMSINAEFMPLFWPLSLAAMATRGCGARGALPTFSDRYFRAIFGGYADNEPTI